MIHEMTNTYSRPIGTPVHQFRSADETCSRCHNRDTDHGEKVVVKERFAHDASSTTQYSALRLHLGGGQSGGIHYHARSDVKITFTSADNQREEIQWVEVERPDGSKERYSRVGGFESKSSEDEPLEERLMDCTDCHNRTGHPFHGAGDALDSAMASGKIDSSLPRIKDKGYGVLTGAIPQHAEGDTTLERVTLALERYFAAESPETWNHKKREIAQAGQSMARIYDANVHPEMNIDFGTYPDQSAHPAEGAGCFRCHSDALQSESGAQIEHSCSTCHDVLADAEKKWSMGQEKPPEQSAPGAHSH